jgi:hypothetical protein
MYKEYETFMLLFSTNSFVYLMSTSDEVLFNVFRINIEAALENNKSVRK